ncbi:MAG: hypothetical protein DRR00_10860 [Candidatus Parabeggiatoa sp. nov. 3]|nr:MAG: hypothetical protein DRR00_10860 [Gammaproteobacteria bacterium]RKZ57047.1 MAG: hypothetical protein DRQ99_27570 [Gammaproteobacteria bacterium]
MMYSACIAFTYAVTRYQYFSHRQKPRSQKGLKKPIFRPLKRAAIEIGQQHKKTDISITCLNSLTQ